MSPKMEEDQRSSMSRQKLLTIFSPSSRFSLDIDATRFYTFFNCNIRIAEIDATHRKGRIGKMATKKAAKKAPAKKAAKKAVKKAAKKK